jgi:hypothetical protein
MSSVGYKILRRPFGQNTIAGSINVRPNIPLYRNSDLSYVSPILIRRKGAVVRRHEPRIGLRWTLSGAVADAVAGRAVD